MDNLKERLARLTPEQRTQLLNRLNNRQQPIATQRHRDAVPLSFSQRRLWFLDQFEPGSTNYNILRVYRVRGPLDIDVLRRAVNEIVRRHASLRTSFLLQADLPVQHIASSLSLEIPLLHADDDAAVQRLLRAEADTPFDLKQAPLLRAAIIRQGPQLHTLLFNLHHIITDGWSQGIFVRELSQLYAAFSADQPSPLPDLTLQYADFAVAQQDAEMAGQLEHWRRQLASPPVLEFPTDRPRPPQMSQRGAVYRYALPPELATRLQQLAVKERATLFMVLMAAFQVLLGRYSGQQDLTVGTPIAGRNRSELEGIIGFFVNTLVMRANLSGDPTFSEFLARTRAAALDAYTHQDIPFEKLVEELLPERDLSRSPLFQVMFVLQNTPPGTLALAGAEVEAIPVETTTAKFDLSLSITESGGGLACLYNYNTDLFDHASIERLAVHYRALLEDALDRPDRSISRLNLLGPGERQHLLHDWNDTRRDYAAGDTLAGLFERQAVRTPGAVAVIDGGRQVSYRELNEHANRLARHLLAQGVGRGQAVAVALYLDRGLELITAILAVLKAGGAYLPLDTRHPAQRLRTMLADAGAGTVLGTRVSEAKWPCGSEHPFLAIDALPAAPDTPCANLGLDLQPDDLAYIIYTSGSTGVPKGVMIEHRSVINLARGLHDEIFSNSGQGPWRVALNSAITFDASVQQWTRLLFGDTLVLIPEDTVPDPAAFGQALTAARVDVLGCTPTQLRQLFTSGLFDADHAAPSLVLCGGEAIDADLWRKAAGHARSRFYNVYGPTECTVDATCCRIDAAAGAPHIGRPLPNLQAYILDTHQQPVPIGVTGELYLAGAGVGRGYLHRPELTQERFVIHPFGENPSERAYRSGDLARYRADGNIEFLGRRDSQIKLRGYRIELGEIESQLKQLPNVRDCVAMLREDRPGDQRIIAYVITDDGDIETLQHQLRQRMPEYMLPSDIVRLDHLPLNASGKIDRQALPRPQRTRATGKDYAAPRTELEQALAESWREVLDIDTLGVHDNFFALGGHSLLAVRVISNINQRLGSRLTLRELFESPTIHALAGILARGHSPVRSVDTELTVVRERNDLPLSYSQQRLWFLDQFEPGSANYNIPIAYRIRGALDIDALHRAINEMVRRHEGLRTTFALRGDTPVQVISPALNIELPVLQARDDDAVQRLILDEANTPFDLQHGPLLRAAIISRAPHEQVLLLNQHHIVSDGWSMGIFTRELARLYQAFSAGQPSPLPEPAFQYADFAVWQQRRQAQLTAQVGYWKQKLAQAPVLELPTDRPRPKVQSYRGAILRRELPEPLAREIRHLAQQQGVTLFMLLLAAFQALLGRYSGQEDLTVGTPIAGRDRGELEDIIGFFINTLVLRADLSGNPSFTELLSRTRAVALDAFSHHEAPFEKLVEELLPERDMSRNPLFQVMFVLQNTPPAVLTLAGTEVQPIAIPIETEKFDLSLSITEMSGTLSCAYNYNTDLFDGTSIERMARHFHQLLAAVVAEPGRPLAGIDLLSAGERQQLLYDWNDTRRDYPLDQTVHALFEAQAARTPQACAVSFGEQQLTYAELNARANRLAQHLIAQQLPREQPVAILMPRCPELITAVLGVLKAGGAYLPLDIRHPPRRLNTIMADAGAKLVLRTHAQAAAWSGGGGYVWLEVDSLTQDGGADAGNPGLAIRPRDLAYVIYTSGSTGLPKGVMIEHRSVVNLACAMQDTAFTGHSAHPLRVAMSTALSFDASVDQWIRLLYGDCVALIPEDTVMDTWAFLSALQSQRIDVLSCTPTELRNLLHEGLFDRQPYPSLVLCGGEAMDRDLWRRCARLPHTRVYNVYGPTECTVDATCARVREAGDAPHIGRPLPNVRAYVLDAQRRPVPVGVAGELYLGGAGVARGYLRRPELDTEVFLADTFTAEPGGRLYKTGDMARHRADGRIEYLGRRDAQIKLRGLRIEPGEIETRLKQLTSVRDCVVIVREDEPGDQCLAAYVIVTDNTLDDLTIKSWLKTGLPDYMVPGDIVRLEQFPLTSSGKLDHKALPAPQRQRGTTDALIAPRTRLEEEIAALWCELLRTDRVGVHDNFFSLGGHSLLGTRLMINLNRRYAARLPLRVLFETPTVEGLATALQRAGAGREDRQHPGIAGPTGAAAIIPRQAREPAPLSYAQQRLWFLDQLYPGKADYNLPQLLRLEGPLDVEALRGGLAALLARHDALRTRFIKHNTEARQVVGAADTVVLAVIDLSGAGAPEAELDQRVRAEVARAFDLMQGPLLRATLYRIADESYALLVVMHHIVSDGWSMDIFNRELGAAYDALLQRRAPAWTPLPIQYTDFAVWQRAQDLQGQLDYWKEQLRDAPQVLELPNDKPRPAVQTFDGDQVSVAIPHDMVPALNGLALREHATNFMLLLAVFQLLLHRYSGQRDILVGTPIAGRSQAELEGLIGFFVNSLVLRARLDPAQSFLSFLRQVRASALDAFEHQEVPFEKLVEILAPQRDKSRNPLFQVMFTYQNQPYAVPSMQGLRVGVADVSLGKAKFDLTLAIQDRDGDMLASFNYNSSLFERPTIERMTGHFLRLLQAVAEDAERNIGQLPLLTVSETEQLVRWNDTARELPQRTGIAAQFEAQAASAPHAIAAQHGADNLRYGELNARANRLAHHLLQRDMAPGDLVGLCLERGLDTLAAMLAILKCGGAYVPLDPSYPKERLALMIEDAGLATVICRDAQRALLPAHIPRLISLDSDRYAIERGSAANPPAAADGDSLAYIIYTSGSTGKPKGVCVTQRGVIRLVRNTDYVALDADDIIAQASNTAFDAATFEIWGALLNGGRVVIVPREILLSQDAFTELLRSQGVTTLFLTTALFNQMISVDSAAFRSLKQLLFGGETCDPKRIRECLAGGPPRRLLHVYGPTETTTFATWYEITQVDPQARTVPIGRPIANTTCQVLDAQRQPVPVGVTGELYIGGAGVARGYLHRQELSAERFIPDPQDAGGFLYRSGDLVRQRTDGAIEFVGRVDHQIKLRGFRIELGEIDEALRQHPDVQDAVTLLREDSPGDKRLVAYLSPRPGRAIEDTAVRGYLKQRLPEYMIPVALVSLDRFPLNANGKVDRAALPASGNASVQHGRPRSTLEFHLVKIWEDILGRAPIGVEDNFFALGGHSLLAVKLMDQIEMHFGKRLPLDTLWFDAATVASMTRILEQEHDDVLWPELVPIKGGGELTPLFVIHTMGGNLFHYYELARHLSPHLPVYGLQARGVYGRQPPRDSVVDIAADCIEAMRRRQPHGPYRIAGFSSGGIVAYEMAQQLQHAGEAVSRLVLLDCYAPGVRIKGVFWKQVYNLVRLQKLRQFQERLYHSILHPLGLRRLRTMHSIGEIHRWAHWSYKPQPYRGRIDLFVAAESETSATDPLLGWSRMAAGDLLVHATPGTHGHMVKSPHVEVLAQKLQSILDQDA